MILISKKWTVNHVVLCTKIVQKLPGTFGSHVSICPFYILFVAKQNCQKKIFVGVSCKPGKPEHYPNLFHSSAIQQYNFILISESQFIPQFDEFCNFHLIKVSNCTREILLENLELFPINSGKKYTESITLTFQFHPLPSCLSRAMTNANLEVIHL